MSKKQSVVWENFMKSTDKKSVICNICTKTLKYFGNTSNLRDHLKRKHDEVAVETLRPSTGDSNASTSEPKVRKTIQLSLASAEKLPESKINKINIALVKMVAGDFQPLSIVEDEGFLTFVRELQPMYQVPSRKQLSTKLLPQLYDFYLKKVKTLLDAVLYVALTTDIWTADTNVAYICVTAHFVHDNEMYNISLKTMELIQDHTAENLAAVLKNICDEFNISHKISIVVSDNGANIKKAVQLLNKHHHPCVAHTLNLTVNESIKDSENVAQILAKCRDLVAHFKRSTKSAEILRNVQKQMNLPELKVKQDVITRWNSAYQMIERLLEIKIPLSAALASISQPPQALESTDWDVVKDCAVILKPLEEITIELSGHKYPTMSMIVPLVRGLQMMLKSMQMNTEPGKIIQRKLVDSISRRLGGLETNKTVSKACFCDPRFKKKGFGISEHADRTQRWVEEEIVSIIRRDSASPSSNPQPESSINAGTDANLVVQGTSPSSSSIWGHFDQTISGANETSPTSKAVVMLKQYLDLPLISRLNNPISSPDAMLPSYFKELKELQSKYLAMPATSVPAESLFSKAGYMKNCRRNRLSSNNLNSLLFLNSIVKNKNFT